MTLCTPTMTITFWVAIAATSIAGFWFIWKRYDLERKYRLRLEAMQKKLDSTLESYDAENELIRSEYETARRDYLEVMKEMQSEDIPTPGGDYLPD